MKKIYPIALLLCTAFANAQTTADFENISLDSNSYRNGSDTTDRNGFITGNALFTNFYDTSWGGFWAGGFAVSNKTDVRTDSATVNYTKMYTAVTGSGAAGTANYAIAQNQAVIRLVNTASRYPDGVYLTNSNYTYLSMKWGDAFARKFNDSDYLKVTFTGYNSGTPSANRVSHYLAQGRNISDQWVWVDLKPLAESDSIVCMMESSDTLPSGMNTPGFFCIDELTTSAVNTTLRDLLSESAISLYPNPARDVITIQVSGQHITQLEITDLEGRRVALPPPSDRVSVDSLNPGVYVIFVETTSGRFVRKFAISNQ